jgi:carbon monoxide dehydrogenase subunit G
MQLRHEFTLPISPHRAWATLLDVERVAPCMPGATLDHVDGDNFSGRVTLKVGPLRLSYRGDARITEKDERARRLVIVASGREAKGSGTAEATVTASLEDAGEGTRVELLTDLALTGRAAQFGRGLVSEVSGTIIGQFADRLAQEMQTGGRSKQALEAAPTGPVAPEPASDGRRDRTQASAPAGTSTAPSDEDTALDVLSLVRSVVGGRGLFAAAGVAGAVLAFLLGRRGRSAATQLQQVPWPVVVLVEGERG